MRKTALVSTLALGLALAGAAVASPTGERGDAAPATAAGQVMQSHGSADAADDNEAKVASRDDKRHGERGRHRDDDRKRGARDGDRDRDRDRDGHRHGGKDRHQDRDARRS